MSPTPREIEARYNGRCAVCHGGIPAGTRVSYTPPYDGQPSRLVHLTCVARDRSRPEPTFEPFDDRIPLPARLTEYAENQVFEQSSRAPAHSDERRYQSRRRTVEQTGRVPGRDPKRPCPACDDSGYQCDVCGNPGLENAPCNRNRQEESTASGRRGRGPEGNSDAPEVDAAHQSNQPVQPRLSAGFPRRPGRARHLAASVSTETSTAGTPRGNPDLPRNPITGRIKSYVNVAGCPTCEANRPGPSHTGSASCRSGSLASGGLRAHCSCSTCF